VREISINTNGDRDIDDINIIGTVENHHSVSSAILLDYKSSVIQDTGTKEEIISIIYLNINKQVYIQI
jgi:hypothetical protein